MLNVRGLARAGAGVAAVLTALALPGASAQAKAGGIAYVAGGEVWVASLDGAAKVRLSGGEGDWTHVAQGDDGHIVATRVRAGASAQETRFTVWRPDGSVQNVAPLVADPGWDVYAYPLGLDITPNGGRLVYGFRNQGVESGTPTTSAGHYVIPTATKGAGSPYKNPREQWPTLLGGRVVGTANERWPDLQDAAGAPQQTVFTRWPGIDLSAVPGRGLRRTDVAANGRVLALEVATYDGGAPPQVTAEQILVLPVPGPGLPPTVGGCALPATGRATDASLSSDATSVAWADQDGVKVAGVPDFAGGDPCTLTRPPVLIAAGGTSASLGPVDVPAVATARKAAGHGGGAGASGGGGSGAGGRRLAVSVAARPRAATLGRRPGLGVTVTAPKSGTVTATLSVAPARLGLRRSKLKLVVIARGSARTKAAGKLIVRLRATAAARPRLRRLARAGATLTVTQGGQRVTKHVRFR